MWIRRLTGFYFCELFRIAASSVPSTNTSANWLPAGISRSPQRFLAGGTPLLLSLPHLGSPFGRAPRMKSVQALSFLRLAPCSRMSVRAGADPLTAERGRFTALVSTHSIVCRLPLDHRVPTWGGFLRPSAL